MQSIEDLQFEICRHITGRGIECLASRPRLRVISVLQCPQVGRESMPHFGKEVRVEWAF